MNDYDHLARVGKCAIGTCVYKTLDLITPLNSSRALVRSLKRARIGADSALRYSTYGIRTVKSRLG